MRLQRAKHPIVKQGDRRKVALVHIQMVGVVPYCNPVQGLPGETVQVDSAMIYLIELGVDHCRDDDG